MREYLFSPNESQMLALETVLLGVALAENSFDFAVLLVGDSVAEHIKTSAQGFVEEMIGAETDPDEKEMMKSTCCQRGFRIDLSGK